LAYSSTSSTDTPVIARQGRTALDQEGVGFTP
jgi:hypothetical protein